MTPGRISNGKVFLLALLAALGAVLLGASYSRLRHPVPRLHFLTADTAVTEQLEPAMLGAVRRRGFDTVIDLRPDGEAADQPSAATMAEAAHAEGLHFDYVPVPHGAIPPAAAVRLAAALQTAGGHVLLYCRSGRRAARTWSLVEASRADGLAAEGILRAVANAGQSADDLRPAIEQRVAQRPAGKGHP